MIKRPIITILLLFIIIDTYSQVLNLNPDPDGDPWYAGSLRELSANDSAWLESLTVYSYSDIMAVRDLPASLDNSENEWFRTIFNQQGGSCGQASGVGYNFTYEIDYVRGIPANTTDNQYPTHYTWNFLNGGNGGGSWYFDGWQIIDANGCPNITDYGGGIATGGPTRWMSGYDSYYNGMHNRMLEVFSIPVGTEEGLETLKQWMHNHLDGSDAGGLANFAAGVLMIIFKPFKVGDFIFEIILLTHFFLDGPHLLIEIIILLGLLHLLFDPFLQAPLQREYIDLI